MADRTVLVSGASSGIGHATARTLLAKGYTVYIAARRVERMRDLEKSGAIAVSMDITREDDVRAVVDQITARHGAVDVLVNNAGFGMFGAMEDTSLDDVRYQFEVNLFGLARLTQLVLPGMRRQRSGKIINISSMGGRIYSPLASWYHATKHALEGWSDCLRLELAPLGIDVVVIEPGVVESEFGDVAVGPLLDRSGTGAYADLARRVARTITGGYEPGGGSPTTVIADVVAGAVAARRPRTRYAAGRYARPMLGLRRLVSDRMFDRIIMSRY